MTPLTPIACILDTLAPLLARETAFAGWLAPKGLANSAAVVKPAPLCVIKTRCRASSWPERASAMTAEGNRSIGTKVRSALSVVACAALCESFGGADQAAKRPTAEVTIFILPCACLSLRTKCCFYVCQQGTKSFRSESGGRSAADIVICLIGRSSGREAGGGGNYCHLAMRLPLTSD